MTEAIAPLVPADCDLRDFAFMPLDVVRLRDSDLVAMESAEAFRAAVMLWCASWHQLPAASLPDDDRVLANLAGYGRVVKEWQKERTGALRGWVLCSDGRLYHPVVAEKAVEAWKGKLERQWRTECARMKKHYQRHEMQVVVPEFDEWLSSGRPQGQPLPVLKDKQEVSQGQQTTVPGVSPGKVPPRDRDRDSGQGQGQLIKEEPPPGVSGAAKKASKKCPGDFHVTAELQAWADEKVPGLDVAYETDKFRDWEFKAARSDWPATWRTWMRKAYESRHNGAPAPGQQHWNTV